jgi:hypothetical protein
MFRHTPLMGLNFKPLGAMSTAEMNAPFIDKTDQLRPYDAEQTAGLQH